MFPFVLSAASFVVGVGMLGYGIWSGRRANASQLWDSVPGELVSTEVIERRGKYGTRSYSVRVFYRYSVEGREYEARRLCFGAYVWEGLDEINLWVEQNTPRVEVFFDPKSPAASVLMPGRAGADGTALYVILGGLMTAMGLFFFFAANRM